MLNFLFKKEEVKKDALLSDVYSKLKELYGEPVEDRKTYLAQKIEQYGYLPYSHIQALEALTPAEVLFGLEIKWAHNKTFEKGKFVFENDKISALARAGVKNSNWIKKEGHDVKLLNLAGLGNGNKSDDVGKFIDWLTQLLILPTGVPERNIFPTTLYIIPFHPREFGCAYLPSSSEVSPNLEDTELTQKIGLDLKSQVQTFVTMAQLAGHPVIYDILPQTGRFAKVVLANPYIARWYDITELLSKIENSADEIAKKLEEKFDKEDVEVIKDVFKQTLRSGAGELSEYYQGIFSEFEVELLELKKVYSNEMMLKENQVKLQKRVKEIVAEINGTKPNQDLSEDDITKQPKIVQELIKQGLWPAPGGAWCSAGVPIFDKMSDCGGFPVFIHYDFKGVDVTHFANLDCQTPFYFAFLENGKPNKPVVDFFIKFIDKLRADYNFDGFRVDHIDHIVDEVSQKNGLPISYRAPASVLNALNLEMKKKVPHFVSLAEYMLWDGFLKQYHEDMNFDILWGNDIISQFEKTPEAIIEDNLNLVHYNTKNFKIENLSILKTYNNQDGEFRVIDQYPGQLGEAGALFKWFKYKMLPGGKHAQRPMLYIDGDESFTKTGVEATIGSEISMQREDNKEFFAKFDAINRFAKSQELVTEGEASLIKNDDDGFAGWMISKEPLKTAILVVANSQYPMEKVTVQNDDGSATSILQDGTIVSDKTVFLPSDYRVSAEFVFDGVDYVQEDLASIESELSFDSLEPSEFKIFLLQK